MDQTFIFFQLLWNTEDDISVVHFLEIVDGHLNAFVRESIFLTMTRQETV